MRSLMFFFFFFFNDTATTEIYTLSLHDALPIWPGHADACGSGASVSGGFERRRAVRWRGSNRSHAERRDAKFEDRERLRREDRKSTRLNSSHSQISYAVFCLKKKKK